MNATTVEAGMRIIEGTAKNMGSMRAETVYVERESVAEVVAFLASEAARNVTGQVLLLA